MVKTVKVKVGKPGRKRQPERTALKKELSQLRIKPDVIEAALKHCSTEEDCGGCPLLHNKTGYCGQLLNTEALKYIEILKELNKTLAQEIERREEKQTTAITAKAD